MKLPQTVTEAAAAVRQRKVTPLELVEHCLHRIEKHESQIHAWVVVDADGARATARQLGEEATRGILRGPLHGVPIGIKDIYDLQGFPTLAGARLREREPQTYLARADAFVVARLRAAGAIFLGKTVTTEFASFDPSPTRNPWNPRHTPGGSSSGSAAATAVGMCYGALGSQTGGSITRPASYCGVAGCKPTYGRSSLRGVVPLSCSMDHPGPIARTVGDLALLLQIIAGPDEQDPFTAAEAVPKYSAHVRADVDPPRLGLVESFFMEEADADVQQALRSAANCFRKAGAAILPSRPGVVFPDVIRWHRRVMGVEAAEYHRPFFPARRAEYGPKLAGLMDECLSLSVLDYAEARRNQLVVRHAIVDALKELDALLVPATTSAAPGMETTGDPKFQAPWSYAGVPTVCLPCGLNAQGLPLAIQVVGRPWQEGPLLAVAAWCESHVGFVEMAGQKGPFVE